MADADDDNSFSDVEGQRGAEGGGAHASPREIVLGAGECQKMLDTKAGPLERKGSSSTAGFSDANRILNRPSCFGSLSHDYDLLAWFDWAGRMHSKHGFSLQMPGERLGLLFFLAPECLFSDPATFFNPGKSFFWPRSFSRPRYGAQKKQMSF